MIIVLPLCTRLVHRPMLIIHMQRAVTASNHLPLFHLISWLPRTPLETTAHQACAIGTSASTTSKRLSVYLVTMSLLLHRTLPIRTRTAVRALSTTAPRCISLQLEKNDPDVLADTVPAYPYGRARWYKQSDLGLYGGQRIQFGNNVGPKSKTKTRRTWHPNVFNKRLYSRALGRYIQLRVSTRVLRTIDKLGGLDKYLLGDKEARIKELGMSGWWLRWAIMQTPSIRRKFAAEREALGLPPKGVDEMVQEEMAAEQVEEGMNAVEQLLISDEGDIVAEPGVDVLQEVGELEDVEVQPEVGLQTEPTVELQSEVELQPEPEAVLEPEPRPKRLKFRAGRRTHIYHTPEGWRRTKPDPEILFKKWMRKDYGSYYNEFHDRQHAIAFQDFDQVVKDNNLTETEVINLRKRLQTAVDRKAERIVKVAWERESTQRIITGIVSRRLLNDLVKVQGYEMPKTRGQARHLPKTRSQGLKEAMSFEAKSKAEARAAREAKVKKVTPF